MTSLAGRCASVPLPVTLFVLALAMPPEASLQAGALRLSAYRVVLLVMFLPAFCKLFSRRAGRVETSDWLMLFHGLWAIAALIMWGGVAQGIESGGIYLAESTGAYFLARVWIRSTEQMRSVARLFLKVVLCMLFFTVIEAVTGYHLLREVSRAVLGGPSLPFIERRLGLARAFGSFEHPILYGMFCSAALGMSLYALPHRRSPWRAQVRSVAVFVAVFMSVSSGALAAAMVQVALSSWDRLTRAVKSRWSILFGSIGLVWAVITLASNRGPMKVFLTYFTFSPGTAYNRLRIWDYGTAEVSRQPLLGIGLGEWQRPAWMVSSSMDNFWLATAVRYGFPAFAFLFLAAALIVLRAGRRPMKPAENGVRYAWMMSVAGMALGGSTVHYWNALLSLFCFLLGLGVWLGTAKSSAARAPMKVARKPGSAPMKRRVAVDG